MILLFNLEQDDAVKKQLGRLRRCGIYLQYVLTVLYALFIFYRLTVSDYARTYYFTVLVIVFAGLGRLM